VRDKELLFVPETVLDCESSPDRVREREMLPEYSCVSDFVSDVLVETLYDMLADLEAECSLLIVVETEYESVCDVDAVPSSVTDIVGV
jgi:hypothetical protein